MKTVGLVHEARNGRETSYTLGWLEINGQGILVHARTCTLVIHVPQVAAQCQGVSMGIQPMQNPLPGAGDAYPFPQAMAGVTVLCASGHLWWARMEL